MSPIGLTMSDTADENIENVPDNITLKYTAGTEYVIDGEDAYNTIVSLKDSGKSWYVFNRLVDTGKIQSLDIKGHYCNFEDESQENYDRIYTLAEEAVEEVNIHRYIQSGMFEDCECCRIKY